ncbi:MAG TPA: hypothetical protein VGV35_05285 [Bryobacteraceae bacterium]|nr:hypothetical protein [Bryobacteraceae bacterium]
MTSEEIQKLLGGYATNTLTEAERKALFDAALDDQELFNALQDEEALKDLLADPVSRAQVQRALEQPPRPRVSWWNRRWAWAGAASAVAAAVVIVGVVRMNAPAPRNAEQVYSADAAKAPAVSQPASVANKEKAVEPVAPKLAARAVDGTTAGKPSGASAGRMARDDRDSKDTRLARSESRPAGAAGVGGIQNERKDAVAATPPPGNRAFEAAPAAAPAPPPPPPPPATAQQAQVRAQNSASQGGPSQNAAQNQNLVNQNSAAPNQAMRNQLRETDASAASARLAGQQFGGGGAARQTFLLRYSIVKRDTNGAYAPLQPNDELKAGDEVQLNVIPFASGFLSLDHVDAAGTPSHLFPPTAAGLPVVTNTSYTIPESPIEVKDTDQKFRLTLYPRADKTETTPEAATRGRLKTSSAKAKSSTEQSLSKQIAIAPSVEITIGPKK